GLISRMSASGSASGQTGVAPRRSSRPSSPRSARPTRPGTRQNGSDSPSSVSMPSSMADSGERVSRGRAAYASQFRLSEAEAVKELKRVVGERMANEAINAAGGAWVEDCLSLRDRSLIVLAALVTQGGVEERLRAHVRWALDHDATPDELEAMCALLAVYIGYPRASVAMETMREVVSSEQADSS